MATLTQSMNEHVTGFRVWEERNQQCRSEMSTVSTPKRRDDTRVQGNRLDVEHSNVDRQRKVLQCSTQIRSGRVNEQGKSRLRIKTTLAKSAYKDSVHRQNRSMGERVHNVRSKRAIELSIGNVPRDNISYSCLSTTLCDTRSESLCSDDSRRRPLQPLDNCFVVRSEEESIASGVSLMFTGCSDSVSLTTDASMATCADVSMGTRQDDMDLTTEIVHRASSNKTNSVKLPSKTCPDLLGEHEERTTDETPAEFMDNMYQGSILKLGDKSIGNFPYGDGKIRWC